MTEAAETIATLDQVLSGDKGAPEQVEPVQESAEPATKEPEADEAKGDDTAETPAAKDDQEQSSVPIAALKDERRKRQELERELAELKKPKPAEPVQRPNAAEDPEGAIQHAETVIEQRLRNERVVSSRNIMVSVKPDYLEKEKIFVELANANPDLVREMHQHESPAMFAYNKAIEHLEHQEYLATKDTPEYKEFLEAKKAGKVQTPEQKRNKSAVETPKLVNATSASSGNATPVDKDLKDILGR